LTGAVAFEIFASVKNPPQKKVEKLFFACVVCFEASPRTSLQGKGVWSKIIRGSLAEFYFPPRNIVEIPVKIALLFWPPRILPRFAEASRRDFGHQEVASRRESQ